MWATHGPRARLGKALSMLIIPRPGEGQGLVSLPPVTYELVPNYTLQGIFHGYEPTALLY